MATKVLLMIPTKRNGGIQTWAKGFLKSFPQDEFIFTHIETAPQRKKNNGLFIRVTTGLLALSRQLIDTKKCFKNEKFDIMHRTTSGSLGALADLIIGKYCHYHRTKNILHCHYGKIIEVLQSKGLIAWLTKKSMQQYDQIWVLDRKTLGFLKMQKDIKASIYLTPNSINVATNIPIAPKSYNRIAFIGNLYVEKGIIDLIKAMKMVPNDMTLDIVGDGDKAVKKQMMEQIGELYNQRIFLHGMLPHHEAMNFMAQTDILVLPTYYPSEAFPISILEAMSLGKLIISTNKGAIPDMLESNNGKCGIIVREKDPKNIADALQWVFENKNKADELCMNAYRKVASAYNTDIVFTLYKRLYKELITH